MRGNLFTSLVICELIAVVTRTSKSLGLGWRNHVMALGNGWTAWAVIAILVDGLHSYFGADRYFVVLEHVRMFAYLAALGYWMVQFWLEEPARQPISPELSNYIQALHRRIKLDLDTLGCTEVTFIAMTFALSYLVFGALLCGFAGVVIADRALVPQDGAAGLARSCRQPAAGGLWRAFLRSRSII